MRLGYIDEAGTSANEAISLVAGILIPNDRVWNQAEALLKKAFDDNVPSSVRDKFAFHACEIYNGYGIVERDVWTIPQRYTLLEDI